MPGGKANDSALRSDKRIPKLRTRGRANRDKLLGEAQRLIEGSGGQQPRFSEVFKAAKVSRGSAYRIYDGIEDLMQDLASSWMNRFVHYVHDFERIDQPGSWMELSDQLIERAAQYWINFSATLQALPRVRTNTPDSYRAAVKDLTRVIAGTFDRYFVMPQINDWLPTLGMYTSLADSIFADAVRREGRISEQRIVEAQKICNTYLSFYLPTGLPPRTPSV